MPGCVACCCCCCCCRKPRQFPMERSNSSTDLGSGLPLRFNAAIFAVMSFIHSYLAMQSSTYIFHTLLR